MNGTRLWLVYFSVTLSYIPDRVWHLAMVEFTEPEFMTTITGMTRNTSVAPPLLAVKLGPRCDDDQKRQHGLNCFRRQNS